MSDQEPDTTPLCVASEAQLLAEVERRFHAYVMVWQTTEADGTEETHHSHRGGFNLALGLLERSKHYWLSRMVPKWTEYTRIKTEPDDDGEAWKGG